MIPTISSEIAEKTLQVIFDKILANSPNQRKPVSEADFAPTEFNSGDGCKLSGWLYQPRPCSKGTVFFMHGFTRTCEDDIDKAKKYCSQFGLTGIAFDQRYHGWSERKIPTFGTQESFDLQACMGSCR